MTMLLFKIVATETAILSVATIMTPLAVTDTVWIALIAAVVTLTPTIMARRAEKKAEQVRVTLEKTTTESNKKLDTIAVTSVKALATGEKAAETGEKVHVLVNSNYGAQLLIISTDKRRIADMTKLESDIKIAEIAEEAYRKHVQQQASIDAHMKELAAAPSPVEVRVMNPPEAPVPTVVAPKDTE